MGSWKANQRVQQCASIIAAGGVVAYPTESVWGLGTDPYNQRAVQRILEIKKRPWEKGLILIAANLSQVEFVVCKQTFAEQKILADSWPGHNTWVMEHHGLVPEWVTGKFDTVAIRVSDHPVVKALCELANMPIVSTSANPAGMPPAKTEEEVKGYFKNEDVTFSPGCVSGYSNPSTIRHLHTGQTLR